MKNSNTIYSNPFRNYWNGTKQLQVPSSIFKNGVLTLDITAVSVLCVLLYIHKQQRGHKPNAVVAIVKVGQKKLTLRTGFERTSIWKGTKQLEDNGYVEITQEGAGGRKGKRKAGEAAAYYVLLNPKTGDPLFEVPKHGDADAPRKRGLMIENEVTYFTIPKALMSECSADWSLANLAKAQLQVYLAVCWLAAIERNNVFNSTAVNLRTTSGLSRPTFKKALEELRRLRLIYVLNAETRAPIPIGDIQKVKELRIQLCDPYTGEPLCKFDGEPTSDAADWYTETSDGNCKRLNFNQGTLDQIEGIVRSCLALGEDASRRGEELVIRCPFHNEQTPSCSLNLAERGFNCFGCPESGSLTKLLMKMTGEVKGQVLQRIGSVLAPTATFHDHDILATKYTYKNPSGTKTLKEVLRYPNDDQGRKVFKQRRPGPGGWIWDVKGVPPSLYNVDLIKFAGIVVIVEGEKDAKTITDVNPDKCSIVGVTSGGASSWQPGLAKSISPRKLILLAPDSDEAGDEYGRQIGLDLDAEGLQYERLSWKEHGCKDPTEFAQKFGRVALRELIQGAFEPRVIRSPYFIPPKQLEVGIAI